MRYYTADFKVMFQDEYLPDTLIKVDNDKGFDGEINLDILFNHTKIYYEKIGIWTGCKGLLFKSKLKEITEEEFNSRYDKLRMIKELSK